MSAVAKRSCLPIALLLISVVHIGCGKDAEFNDIPVSRVFEQQTLDELVEDGLDDAFPIVPPERIELLTIREHRSRIATAMQTEVQSAMAPLTLAASLFAIEGAADLLLAITPVHHAKHLGQLFREGHRLRKQSKKLDKLAAQLSDISGHPLDELVRITKAVDAQTLAALKKIRSKTESAKTTHKLMLQDLNGKADAQWIARQLDRRAVDRDFVRRFEFDGDLVREYTEHSAHPPWNTLQELSYPNPHVTRAARNSLASKVTGLMAERAATDIVRSHAFRRRYFANDSTALSLARGVGYGGNRSIDIVASGQHRAVFVEVKNWSDTTWDSASQRRKVIAQLKRHNDGVRTLLAGKTMSQPPAKLLMVRKDGFEMMLDDEREKLLDAIKQRGWTVELIPDQQIAGFSDLIDSVKQ